MRKKFMVLLASVLLASPLWGQERPEGLKPAPGMRGKPTSAVPTTPISQRAFFSLAGELVPPGSRELKFEVRIDGRPVLQDVIQLPFDAAGATVELLAGDPDGLASVFARAEKAGRKARISVVLDGRELETFTLSEFLAYNRRFQESPPNVVKPLGEVRTFSPEGKPVTPPSNPQGDQLTKDWDPNCLANCDTNRDYCYQTDPSCYGVDYCDVCENQWGSCSNGCWICTDPKSVTEYTTSRLKSASWRGSACLSEPFRPHYWYDYYNYVIENTRWRRTEYCNGSHVDTYLYSWDTTGSCIRNTYFQCSFSTGSAFGSYCPF